MTGKPYTDFSDWTALWGDAQQKYWQSWMDLARQAGTPKPDPAPHPWLQGFDQWARLVAGAAPAESRDWVSKLSDVNRGYLQMAENLWKMLSAAPALPQTPEAWRDAVTASLKQMQDGFAAGLGAGKDPWAGFATFWGMPMDNWKRVYSACSAMPGDMEKAFRSFSAGESPEQAVQRLFSMPTVGYTREWQAEVQRWQQLWMEHGEAVRAYGKVLAAITADSAERLSKKLADLAAEEKTPATLRDFYNLWVDAGEEAYAEAALKPEFTGGQARLVNTLMAVKRHEQKMVDEVLGSLNMPTRRELDTSHRRVHALQRQVWQLQDALDDSGIAALRKELASLTAEVAALRGEAEAPALEKRPAPRRAAGKSA
jgi:class III poly(R)-hydroxyalkanoic acid synthase PhaE subunit